MKVLVLGAGGPAGVNTCKALHRAGHQVIAADANPDHLQWVADYAEPFHMQAPSGELIDLVNADVVIPQPDELVDWLVRTPIQAATFLPSREVIDRCQNKAATVDRWWHTGLRDEPPFVLEEPWPDHLHLAADKLGLPLWLRATKGAGAKGAILVRSLDQAFHWIRFWQSRGADVEWVAEEYLPGADFAWSSVWHQGSLVTSFTRRRLEYLYPHLTPEGLTGTPTIAEIVWDEEVNFVARKAVLACDSRPHGIYSVDLREDSRGHPRPTEINAGRGFTTFGLWSMYGPNFLHLCVKLAVGCDPGDWKQWNALPMGLRLERHIDIPARFVSRYETVARRKPLTLCA